MIQGISDAWKISELSVYADQMETLEANIGLAFLFVFHETNDLNFEFDGPKSLFVEPRNYTFVYDIKFKDIPEKLRFT